MLRNLTLTNFRKHTDLSLNFTSGLQVLRGVNEAGKSTITEAILYSLYGTSLLRTTLDEAVTWGHKPSTLKVELELEIQGKSYTFARSSAGAEVQVDSTPYVTGQKEVSAFAATILGADGKAVQRLVFANQNSIRGALEEGPKAVATQIETLCDFDIFDTVIERMQEKLILGSPSILEARLRDAEDKLACFVAPVKPDIDSIKAEITVSEKQVQTLDKEIEAADKATASAFSLWQNAENAQRMHTTVTTNLRKQEEDLRLHTAQLEAAEAKVKKAPDQGLIDAYKVQLADAATHVRKLEAFKKHDQLTYPGTVWEGDKGSLTAEIDELETKLEVETGKVSGFVSSIQQYATQKETLRSRIITSLTCPTCKQEVKNKDAIILQNATLEKEIASLEEPREAAVAARVKTLAVCALIREDLTALKEVLKSSTRFEQFATAYGEFVEVDLNFVPPKLAWKGDPPSSETLDQKTVKERLSALEQSQDEARRAAGQADALRESIANDNIALANAREQVAQYPAVANVQDLMRAYQSCQGVAASHKAEKQGLQTLINTLANRLANEQAEYDQAVQRGQVIKDEVAECRKDIERLGFNNALLKKIRAIRPLVADRLWNQVLAAVGTMFSSIRGEKSIVTKDAAGFKVNGQAVESLSGSTLDSLGVAIRTALVRTFLPHCTFTVLDEPASGCDADRVVSMLGFLASAGYEQCLLITHDPVSETFADNLIVL